MTVITKDDFIESVRLAFQYISVYHPTDFINAMHDAYLREQNNVAKDAIAQILINSRLAALGKRPICQDTGIACVFLKVGMNVQWDTDLSLDEMVNIAVAEAYTDTVNPLRASIVDDPAGKRINTQNNTPAVTSVELVSGNNIEIVAFAKGFGSESKSKSIMLNPSDSVADWVMSVIPNMGAGWCPPGIIGIGIGGTASTAAECAKHALFEEPINIQQLIARGPNNRCEELRLELFEKINGLGIGAQGLGGVTTVLDVKIKDHPTHAAGLPVALTPNCAATRYVRFTLDGSGPCQLPVPDINAWPDISLDTTTEAKRIDLNTLNKDSLSDLKLGETVLLTGKLITGRDAAHKRLCAMIDAGEPLPPEVDFTNKLIYYVGPVPKAGDEIIGPAGPTTATRMDKFTEKLLAHTNLLGMIGKAERGDQTLAAIKKHKAVYLAAVGGAAFLVSQAIRSAKVLAFEDLGMEAIYEFDVVDMPVIVAVNQAGESIHKEGPAKWQQQLQTFPVKFY